MEPSRHSDPLGDLVSADPTDEFRVADDDEPVRRPRHPDVQALAGAVARAVLVEAEDDGGALEPLAPEDVPEEDVLLAK